MEQIRKDWSEIKSNDSWSIFKIMSEFVEAFDRLSKIGPCVSIFGSARTSEDNKYYLLVLIFILNGRSLPEAFLATI